MSENIERLIQLRQSINTDIVFAKIDLESLYMELEDIEAELEQEESNED